MSPWYTEQWSARLTYVDCTGDQNSFGLVAIPIEIIHLDMCYHFVPCVVCIIENLWTYL
jgi:hypothetical protein